MRDVVIVEAARRGLGVKGTSRNEALRGVGCPYP